MHKLIFKIIIYCALFITMSCNDKAKTISYSVDSLKNLTSKVINAEKISTDIQLVTPTQILGINDSLLIIFDTDADKKCKLINLRGSIIGEFAQLGHSNYEYISPIGISVENDSIINVYDYYTGFLTGYFVSDIMTGNTDPYRRINIREILNNKKINTTINFVQSIGSDQYLLFGNNKNRIILLDKEEIGYIYNEYPDTDSDEECNWAIWGYSVQYILAPDNKHLVLTTYIGSLFEIFNLDDGKVKPTILKGFFPPKYNIVNGATPKWISPDEDSPEGFYALCASNNRFYATIGGVDCEQRNELYSFDYKGNPIGKYILSGDVKCLTQVNDIIFFIIENKNGVYGLYKTNLSELM